jgi:dipeptide/tripeptide permease
MEHKKGHSKTGHTAHSENHYPHLYLMAALSFVAMFVLMYAMADRFANVFVNLNQFYMAGLMAAPMVLIELFVMRAMFPNRRLNLIVAVVSVAFLVLFWILIRQQAAIGNSQFLRSMIPHHAGAVLMCEQLQANDPEIKQLCRNIIKSQKAEIAQMKAKLAQLK